MVSNETQETTENLSFEAELRELKKLKTNINEGIINKASEIFNKNTENLKNQGKEHYNKLRMNNNVEKPSEDAFINAFVGYKRIESEQPEGNYKYLAIADYHPYSDDRSAFYIINMNTNTVEFSSPVAHGNGSSNGTKGREKRSPDSYSNIPSSNQTSLGFFTTDYKIQPGSKHIREGLRVNGKEKGINDNAWNRGIYIHPAGLDQSEGCFILPYDKAEGQNGEDKILTQIQKLEGYAVLFSYDNRVFDQYKKNSKYFSYKPMETNEGKYVITHNPEEINKIDNRIRKNINTVDNTSSKDAEIRECRYVKKIFEKITCQTINELKKLNNDYPGEKKSIDNCISKLDISWKNFKEGFYKNCHDNNSIKKYIGIGEKNIIIYNGFLSVMHYPVNNAELKNKISKIIFGKIMTIENELKEAKKNKRQIPKKQQFSNRHPNPNPRVQRREGNGPYWYNGSTSSHLKR